MSGLIAGTPINAIISSAIRASVHVVGSLLARKLGLPWLADYRDLWNGNPHVDDPRWRAKLLLGLEKQDSAREPYHDDYRRPCGHRWELFTSVG